MTSVPFAPKFHGKADADRLGCLDDGIGHGIPRCYKPGRDYALLSPAYVLDGVEGEPPTPTADILDLSEPGDKGVGYTEHFDQFLFVHRHGPSRRYSTPRKSERARESDRFLHEGSRLGYPTLKGSSRVQVLLLVGLGLVATGLLVAQSMPVLS